MANKKIKHDWVMLKRKDRPDEWKKEKGDVWECVLCGLEALYPKDKDPNAQPAFLPKPVPVCLD
jgi:hypothetical protein